jgi:hypothetical protein
MAPKATARQRLQQLAEEGCSVSEARKKAIAEGRNKGRVSVILKEIAGFFNVNSDGEDGAEEGGWICNCGQKNGDIFASCQVCRAPKPDIPPKLTAAEAETNPERGGIESAMDHALVASSDEDEKEVDATNFVGHTSENDGADWLEDEESCDDDALGVFGDDAKEERTVCTPEDYGELDEAALEGNDDKEEEAAASEDEDIERKEGDAAERRAAEELIESSDDDHSEVSEVEEFCSRTFVDLGKGRVGTKFRKEGGRFLNCLFFFLLKTR